jgi:3-oxosteroid 1-dehydrogenase
VIERTDNLPGVWNQEADLVVVGSGGAGLTGALVAAEEGATVIVLEKAPRIGGTTAVSGGGVWIAGNHHMAEVGVTDTREEALGYVRAVSRGSADDDLLVALVDRGPDMVRYLEEQAGFHFRSYPAIGGTLDYRPETAGAKHGGRPLEAGQFRIQELGEWGSKLRIGTGAIQPKRDKFDYYTKRAHLGLRTFVDVGAVQHEEPEGPAEWVGNGAGLIAQLLRACLDRGVRVYPSTPADDLVIDGGRVVGVLASSKGRQLSFGARRGVLLAAGGFARNEEMKKRLLNRPLKYSCSAPTNEGDGHRMGLAVGAQLSNIADAWWIPLVAVRSEPDMQGIDALHCRTERALPHSMVVNARGRRFVSEPKNYYDFVESFGSQQSGTPNLPAWLIFDQWFKDRYPVLAGAPQPPPGKLPAWLARAGSLEELARALGIDAAGLVTTVATFNANARKGIDPDFGRGESAWDLEWGDPDHKPNPSLGPVETPPFYAIELHPGAFDTKGGLRINDRGQVLSASKGEQPIPGLYSAGNNAAGSVPHAYVGPGATLGPALTFGYIVGLQIGAAVKPKILA